MADPEITSGGKEYIPRASHLLAHAFETDPTLTYMLSSLTFSDRKAYLPSYFETLLKMSISHKGTIEEIDDWKSCGVMLPPGADLTDVWIAVQGGVLSIFWKVGWLGYQKMFNELGVVTTACKKKVFSKGDKYFYIFFLGTHTSARGRGLCTHVVNRYKEVAMEKQLPIYLEAGTEYAFKLYERLGFVLIDTIKLGVGKCDATGNPAEGGPGVTIWGMIWRPEAKVASNK